MKRLIVAAIVAVLATGAAYAEGDATAGKTLSAKCAPCHGAQGQGNPQAGFPKLAGQYPDYIVQALQAYQAGRRKNPIMGVQVKGLSEQAIENLAAYFSSLNGLYTKP